MSLPQTDLDSLSRLGNEYTITVDANMTCIVIHGYKLPIGYDRNEADILLRLSPGYPDVPPDMWWINPPINLVGAMVVPATNVMESYLGVSWQRWSRHLPPGQWLSGIDGLESYLALLRLELERCVPQPVI